MHRDQKRYTPMQVDYAVVRRITAGWGVFAVTRAGDEIDATLIHIANARDDAFNAGRTACALNGWPFMGRDGLENVPATEVLF